MDTFEHRGVVEGFYGEPYRPHERAWLVERMGRWGMNRYLYAPKSDPLHRAEWRTPYPKATMRDFAELVDLGRKSGVEVGFALSPGLSIRYASARDVADLTRKYRAFREIGVRFLGLALDDVPAKLVHELDRKAFSSLAAAHVALAHAVREALGIDTLWWLVPTDYLGVADTEYLQQLGETLDTAVEVGWTGRTVISPSITRAEAEQRSRCLRRPLLLWDNVPVADGPMRPMLHLGPYTGRDPELRGPLSGALLNPMQHPHASALALRCGADFLRDPVAYDAEASWRAAVDELGAGAPQAFASFAAAHRFSALCPEDRDPELEASFRSLRENWQAGRPDPACLAALREQLAARSSAGEALRAGLSDRVLLGEIEPWIEAHGVETARIAAALDLLETLASPTPRMNRALALFGFEARLAGMRTPTQASYGPRRVLYPQLVSMGEHTAGLGPDPALFRDRCLADEITNWAEERALHALRSKR